MFRSKKNIQRNALFIATPIKCFLLGLTLLLGVVQAKAQDNVIEELKGVVRNENGELLAGASVFVQSPRQMTTAGKDGSFVLKNVPANAVIRFSFVGHAVKE